MRANVFVNRIAAAVLFIVAAAAHAAPPDQPPPPVAVAGNGQATVTVAPAGTGTPATGLTVVPEPNHGTDSQADTLAASHVITGLTNGVPYTFRVHATNAEGTSALSAMSNSVTPNVVPGQPGGVGAQAGNTTATVTFLPPSFNDGTPITGYTVASDPPGGVDSNAGSTGTSHLITGLTNGIAYSFTVTATNAGGTGAASAPSNTVRPALPTATITVDSILDGGPGCTLRKAIDNSNGVLDPHADCVTGGLSNTIVFAANGTILLGAPLILVDRHVAINGNGAANTIISGQGSHRIFQSPSGPITVALRNMTLTNGMGPEAGSISPGGGAALFSDATDATVEDVTFTNNIAEAFGGAIVTFGPLFVARSTFSSNSLILWSTLPYTAGGAILSAGPTIISGSTFSGNTALVGGAIVHAGTALEPLEIVNSTFSGNNATQGGAIGTLTDNAPITITHSTIVGNGAVGSGGGIFHGAFGTLQIGSSIVAGNAAGINADCGPSSAAIVSQDYNVFGPVVPCTGAGVTDHDVTVDVLVGPLLGPLASNGGPTQTRKPEFASLARDRSPTCATSADQRGVTRPQGAGCDSGAVELAAPSAPGTPVVTSAAFGEAIVTFTAPSPGDGPITGYTVTSNPPGGVDATLDPLATSRFVNGLTNGTAYTFTVRATNAIGEGPASAPSNSATPTTFPGAPTNVVATPGNTQATVTFSPPAFNGGTPITGYTVTSEPPGGVDTHAGTTATTHVITGLVNGTAYVFFVTATNAVGQAGSLAPSNSVRPRTVPSAPPSITADALSDGRASVSFGIPSSDGGEAITAYTVTSNPPGGVAEDPPALCCIRTMTGLANGTAYTFTVHASNVAGAGAESPPSNSVTPRKTTTISLTGPAASTQGTSVTFNAMVMGTAPTGTVEFRDGGPGGVTIPGCLAVTLVSGLASCATSTLTPGEHTLVAGYPGDVVNRPSGSSPLIHTVGALHTLSVSTSGSGSGTVTSVPAGISCGATCAASFAAGTQVTLTATPAAGSSFFGWSGTCSGAGTCQVPMDAARSATAIFTRLTDIPRLGNLSTRMQVLTGNDVLIGGFVIGGTASKTVAIIATGPSLAAFGIANPLPNPTLQLVRSSDQTVIATNDDRGSAPNYAEIQAMGFLPGQELESAIMMTLDPGAYTAIVSGVGGGTGVAVVAVYEVDRPDVPLTNISTRGRVLTGNNVMIGGFVIQGTGPQTVAIVATGPSLAAFGIANPLQNPTLQLVRSSDQVVIATNDDWGTATNAAQLQAAGFAPTNAFESAILITLDPGAYTAIVSGVGNGTGVAVIAAYKLP